MIDAHIHVVPPMLPGVGSLDPLLTQPAADVAALLREAFQANSITHALAMGAWSCGDDDPLGVESTLQIAALVPGLHAIGIADPTRADRDHLRRVEKVLATGRVKALKAYLGYLHFGPNHPNYLPYYELAAQYQLPFFLHTGDTYSPYAKLKYAMPLCVDEVAVDFPKVRFVMCHLGNPWMTDAAEVVYKNVNVWTDLSGLYVGNEDTFTDASNREMLNDLRQSVQRAFRYAQRPNRFLFGTDWPLVDFAPYRDFIATCIPAEHHDLLFSGNAEMLFKFAETPASSAT